MDHNMNDMQMMQMNHEAATISYLWLMIGGIA